MTHLKDILIDFKRLFVPGDFEVTRYDKEYVLKAEQHSLNKASRLELEKVRDLLKNSRPQHILDLGCNSGRPLDFICQAFEANGSGVDVNTQAILKAQIDYPNRAFLTYQGEELPFENESFDHVMIHHVLGHVKDPIFTLQEIWRVLRPGASVSIITPNTYFKLWQFPFNVINGFSPDISVLRYYDPTYLKQLLQQLSFSTEKIFTFGAPPTACPSIIHKIFLLRVVALARKIK